MSHKNKPRFSSQEPPITPEHKFKPIEAGYFNRYPEFSYRYYEHNHRKYSVTCMSNVQDFREMFEKIKSMSQLKWKDIKKSSQMFHFHPIEWRKTTEPHGFKNLPQELKDVAALQFKVFR